MNPVKTESKILALIIVLVLLPSSISNALGQSDERDEELWQATFAIYLADPLWIERDAYDAGHYLMVPLHAAFWLKNEAWIEDFHNQVVRFLEEDEKDFDELNTMTKLQYLYFLSRYLFLAESGNNRNLVPQALPDFIDSKLGMIWKLLRDQLILKLESSRKDASSAIYDNEYFTFAIASDLKSYSNLSGIWSENSVISEITELAYRVFSERGVFQADGGWLIDPGYLSNHNDYAYAGHNHIAPNLDKNPVEGIAWDSSHFHRFPLWLVSLADAYPEGSEEHNFYLRIRQALAYQFHNIVLIPPSEDFSSYRTTNYMDGTNGIYRYGYVTQGKDNGYEPCELSGTILIGWWTFLGSGMEWGLYNHIVGQFPFSQTLVDLYLGPDTTRDRHPLVKGNAKYSDGVLELISRLAAEIAVKPWDVDRNGTVDLADILIVVANFGRSQFAEIAVNPDINNDGAVNLLDIVIVCRYLNKESVP